MKRMTWRRELRWLIASYLLPLAIWLIQDEMTIDALRAYSNFLEQLENDPIYNTVPMRKRA